MYSKVALSMIVKDDTEAELLSRCLSTIAKFVDGIFVTITNKPYKKLEKIIKNYGGEVSFYTWDKSFARARNYALSQVPDRFDYVVWTDADDMWENAHQIPHLVKLMQDKSMTAVFCTYNYMIDPTTGEVMIEHPRERIIKRGYYEWKGNLHETLIPIAGVTQNAGYFKDIVVNHFPEVNEDEDKLYRNLEILIRTYEEEGSTHDPRTEFYLARNLVDVGRHDEAEQLFVDYLSHSGWDEERAQACNYLGLISQSKKNFEQAVVHFLESIRQKPMMPEPYINLAYTYALDEKWEECEHYLRLYTNIPEPKSASIRVPIDNKVRYYETYFLLAFAKRKISEAAIAVRELLELNANVGVNQERLKGLARLQELTDASKAVFVLIDELKKSGETQMIETLLNGLPSTISDNAYVQKLKNEYAKPKTWEVGSICYFTGNTFEEWSPDSLKKGIGGSETAVIHLAKRWANKGRRVTVYGRFGTKEGIYDGVEYKNYYRFNKDDTFDTLILWRSVEMLSLPLKAKHIYLDLHDVPNNPDFTEDRISKVEKIFVKSNYHKSLLRVFSKGRFSDVPDEKIVVLPNGYQPSTEESVTRNPYKLIYSSSYDRGLQMMLKHGWKKLKEQVPEAELHIYYGWDLWDKVHKNNPTQQQWKKSMLELMSQGGVFEHGRIGQQELLKEKASSAIHWYGSIFEEIDCISVRESAAVGAVPFTTNRWALEEKPYSVRVDGDPDLPETHELLAQTIVEYLLDQKRLDETRTSSAALAQKETWDDIAQAWEPFFD